MTYTIKVSSIEYYDAPTRIRAGFQIFKDAELEAERFLDYPSDVTPEHLKEDAHRYLDTYVSDKNVVQQVITPLSDFDGVIGEEVNQ